MLQGAIAITRDGKQTLAIFGMGLDIAGLGDDPRSAYLVTPVNPTKTPIKRKLTPTEHQREIAPEYERR